MRATPPGLKPVRRPLATGKVKTYWYHRATGVRLKHDPSTLDGLMEVARLNARAAKVVEAMRERGTYAALWDAYIGSASWRKLAPRTRDDYQAVRDYLAGAADKLVLVELTGEALVRLRDAAERKKGRRFANYVIQVLRLTVDWGWERGWLGEGPERLPNPVKGVKLIRKPRTARKVNRAWTEKEISAFAAAAPLQLLVPWALGLFAGMRQGDAITVTWSAIDGDTLKWTASKNGEACEAPITGPLKLVVGMAKAARQTGWAPQIAVTSTGTAWTGTGFRASFFKLVRKLVTETKMEKGASFHGLRRTVVSAARDGGSSDFQAAAAIGDRSTAMAELYGNDAKRIEAQAGVLRAVQERFSGLNVENAAGKRKTETEAQNGKG